MTVYLPWKTRALWWHRVKVWSWPGPYRSGNVARYGGFLSLEPEGVFLHRSQLRLVGSLPLTLTSMRLPGPEVTWAAVGGGPLDRAGVLFEEQPMSRLALISPADREVVRRLLSDAGLTIVDVTI